MLDGFLEPLFVVVRDESVGNDTTALMLPQSHQDVGRIDDLTSSNKQPLPNSAEISQVEDVVELGGRGQHLVLDPLPKDTGCRDKHVNDLTYFLCEATLLQMGNSM